jgi:DNA-binding LacI/PurR family transcriptional regulator
MLFLQKEIEQVNHIIRDIYHNLLSRINSGETKPGELLPGETKLANAFGTNRMNAQRAVKMLENNGLVVRKKRAGTALCDNIDYSLVERLIKEANRIIYVLYSSTPHWIHWNETSFLTLEKEIAPANYSVIYDSIPIDGTRKDYIALLKKISNTGASALAIFPDSEDINFLRNNGDLLLDFQMPVHMLNRSGEPMPLDMVSFVSMDPFSDGINAGTLLKKCGCRNIAMINEFNKARRMPFWGSKRYEGLLLGLQRGNNKKALAPENIPADPNGFSRTLELIKKHRGGMVIVAVNNYYAAKFIDFAKQQGLFIPADYRLIAFDDNPLFRSYNLTSMAAPMQKIGRLFGKLLCDSSWLEEFRGKVSIKVNSELVIRETFKPLS